MAFRAKDSIVGKIPARRRSPIVVGGAVKVVWKEGPNVSPERWGAELEDGRRQIEAALLVLQEFSFAYVRAFGSQDGNTNGSGVLIGPYRQCLDARHVLGNGKRAEACGGGAGALEVNHVNGAEAGASEVGDEAFEEVDGVQEGEERSGLILSSLVSGEGF